MNPVLLAAKAVVEELGGVKAVAAALGKSPTTLAHELDPHYVGAKLGLETSIAIDKLHGQGRIVQAMATAVGGVFMPLPRGSQADTDTGRCVVTVMKETADAIQAAADNLAKNRGENGIAIVHKEGMEAIGALVSMMVASERDAERSKPAHLHAVAA